MSRLPPSLLVHPVPLGAVALMVVNDRFLKAAYHNDLTGKLSDIAICLFLPLLCAEVLILTRRVPPTTALRCGAGAAALTFTALEVCPPVAGLACSLLTIIQQWLGIAGPFVMTPDCTDLLALGMIPTAMLWGLRRLHGSDRGISIVKGSWQLDRGTR
jgi:hypothetical protein